MNNLTQNENVTLGYISERPVDLEAMSRKDTPHKLSDSFTALFHAKISRFRLSYLSLGSTPVYRFYTFKSR